MKHQQIIIRGSVPSAIHPTEGGKTQLWIILDLLIVEAAIRQLLHPIIMQANVRNATPRTDGKVEASIPLELIAGRAIITMLQQIITLLNVLPATIQHLVGKIRRSTMVDLRTVFPVMRILRLLIISLASAQIATLQMGGLELALSITET